MTTTDLNKAKKHLLDTGHDVKLITTFGGTTADCADCDALEATAEEQEQGPALPGSAEALDGYPG